MREFSTHLTVQKCHLVSRIRMVQSAWETAKAGQSHREILTQDHCRSSESELLTRWKFHHETPQTGTRILGDSLIDQVTSSNLLQVISRYLVSCVYSCVDQKMSNRGYSTSFYWQASGWARRKLPGRWNFWWWNFLARSHQDDLKNELDWFLNSKF